MAQQITSADVEAVREALLAIRILQRPDNTLEMSLSAIRKLNDPDLKNCLMNAYVNLRRLIRDPDPGEDEEQENIPRQLRWNRRDRVFTNLMNIACYRFARDEQARRARGEGGRIAMMPYGVPATDSVMMKVENYHAGLGSGSFRGGNDRYATKTIEFLCEFNPTDAELDEAAEYYQTTEQ